MPRDPATLLAYEAKKRPALAEMLKRIDTVSFEDIEAAPFLKWVRLALANEKRSKTRREQSGEATSRAMTWVEEHCQEIALDRQDPVGKTFRWAAASGFIRFNGRSEIEITTGKLLWFPLEGGMLSDGLFSPTVDPAIWHNVQEVGVMTRSAYMRAVDAQVAAGGVIPAASNDPMSAVRISRVPGPEAGW